MLKSILVLVGVLSAASVAKADCIPVAELQKQNPNTASYIHEAKRGNFAISVYRKGESFKDLIEVERQGRCIVSIQPMTADQFISRYLEWPEIWVAEEEGEDNEGMPVDGDEGQEQALSEDEMFPFLTLEGRAIGRKVYSGKIGRPDFQGRDKDFADFKADILQGMSQGVNFSGAYRITQIGCGSSCSIAILSDLRTGKQFKFPHGGEAVGPVSLKFSANSSLMISTWRSGDECFLESLEFDGGKWVTLARPSLGKADLCYESIDDNIAAYKSRNGLKASTTGRDLKLRDATVSDKTAPKPDDEYEDINVTALTDLYEAHAFFQACFYARRGLSPVYVTESEMQKADEALKQSETEILRRNGRIDKDAVRAAAESKAKYHAYLLTVSSRFEVNYEFRKACRRLVSEFPPDIEKTERTKKPSIENEVNTGGGLIIPKNDPRFN